MTRLVLLGLLDRYGPAHGYQLRQQMEQARMNDWVDILYGSIYAALPRMSGEGLVEVVGTSRVGGLPERTAYQITDAGRGELRRLLVEAWTAPSHAAQPVDVALFFLWSLPVEEVDGLLADRLSALDHGLKRVKENELEWERARGEVGAPDQVAEMMNDLFSHARQRTRAERSWVAQLRQRVRAGVFDFGGTS